MCFLKSEQDKLGFRKKKEKKNDDVNRDQW